MSFGTPDYSAKRSVSSAQIADDSIVNADINSAAAIAVSKLGSSGTIPANSGANLTALTAANITAGGTLPALNGAALTAIFPSGSIMLYAGASAPTGWLLCDGTSYLRATYADLHTAIGTVFGTADGTHFNVPDFRGCAPIGVGTGTALTARALGAGNVSAGGTSTSRLGEETHQLSQAELAAHTHTGAAHTHTIGGGGATFVTNGNVVSAVTTAGDTSVAGTGGATRAIDASTGSDGDDATSSLGNDTAHNNMQPSLAVNFIIKT